MNKSVRIVKLDIDEMDDFSGVDAISLVEEPAIEADFMYFSKVNPHAFESYSDYPDSVSNNAKRGIELNEKENNKCATQVGKVRAQQLAKKEPISVETIKRMYSYLSRAEEYYDESDTTACGTISYLLWGGLSGKRWAESKLKELGLFEGAIDVSGLPSYDNEPSGSVIVKLVDPRAGETEDEFISRCIPVVIGEGKDQDQAAAICYSYWEERFEENEEEIFRVLETYVSELFDFLGYADGLPIYSSKEEAQEVAQVAGCGYTYHEHQVGDFVVYMPCESHGEIDEQVIQEAHDEWMRSRMKNFEDLSQDEWESMKDYLESVAEDVAFSQEEFKISKSGIKASNSIRNSQSFLDTPTTKTRFKYVGPISSNSREFCRYLVENFTNKDKVFRKEDINNMSFAGVNKGLGPNGIDQYNIFLYRGGNNCKHNWEEVKFSLINGEWKDTTMSVGKVADPIIPRDPQTPLEGVIGPLGIGAQFSKQLFADKQLLVGPAMIPNQMIYRIDEEGEYYVYFSEETIEKIAYKYMERKYTDASNIEHNGYEPLEDVFVVESWLVKDPKRDKSVVYTGKEWPVGTWMVAMKVKNKEVWEEYVKSGKVKGFSVEGYFVDQLLNSK